MNEYRVRKARSIVAEMRVPGDRSISHLAVLVAALANGPSVITGFLPAVECLSTVQVCRALGVRIDALSSDDADHPWQPDGKNPEPGPTSLRVHGTSMKLKAPAAVLDCGRSETLFMMLSGLLAGQPFEASLAAHESVTDRLSPRIAKLLEAMGAPFRAAPFGNSAPLSVGGRCPLNGINRPQPVSTALEKDAVLMAGLFASGKTTVTPSGPMPDHAERILHHFQVKTLRTDSCVSIYGGQMPESRDFHVPGDISCAANWIVAAAAQPGAELIVRGVGLNDTRTGFLRILVRMGAQVLEDIRTSGSGEPRGTIIVRGAPLRGTVIDGIEAAALRGELPILAVAAALANGTTVIHRNPEDADRMARIAHNLRLMGVEIAALGRGIEIKGNAGARLQPGCVPSWGDDSLAMAFAIAGLFTDGETIIEDIACVESTYAGFYADLRRFQARGLPDGAYTPVVSPLPRGRGWRARG